MLSWALIFAGIAVLGSILEIRGVANVAYALAQLMFFSFLLIGCVVLVTKRGREFLI